MVTLLGVSPWTPVSGLTDVIVGGGLVVKVAITVPSPFMVMVSGLVLLVRSPLQAEKNQPSDRKHGRRPTQVLGRNALSNVNSMELDIGRR